jgi:rare lipoprotein A
VPAVRPAPKPIPGRDGPEANPPPDLDKVPDAEPRVENIRSGGPNKPYEVAGRQYTPITADSPFTERGLASWYGRKFHGRPTASGETYNMYAMTAAHPTLPIPSYVRVRNPANGREVIVRVNDRGPFHSERIIDLSYTAALKLDLLRGVRPVEIERITYDDIRTGAWKRDGSAPGTTMLATVGGEGAATLVPAPSAPAPAPRTAARTSAVPKALPQVPAPVTVPLPAPAAAPAAVAAAAASPDPAASAPAPVPPLAEQPPAADPVARIAAAPEAIAPAPDAAASAPAAAPIASGEPMRALTEGAKGFWIQLGAFRQRDGAMDFQRRIAGELDWLGPLLAVFNDRSVHKLQAGPYSSRGEASSAAERIRAALQLVPVIVERR